MTRLIRGGHLLKDIENYSLLQFSAFLKAADEVEAREREVFVTDMSVVVGSLFSKGDPAGDHLHSLAETAAGVVRNGEARE